MPGELSKTDRKKAIERATKVLPPGTAVRGVVVGRAQGRWSTGAITTLAVFVAIFVAGLVAGVVLYPGALLLLVFSYYYRPQRAIAIADQGVALLTRSGLTGSVGGVVAYAANDTLTAALTGSTRTVQIGPDVVTLSRRETRQLGEIVGPTVTGYAPAPPQVAL